MFQFGAEDVLKASLGWNNGTSTKYFGSQDFRCYKICVNWAGGERA